ncbi:STAS domain-containing protein [Peribacillus sp. SCS-26]|uniref:STAS domain-containing protein n=1 Tax=Paraperibacillus marinus TaxID=3115295 RepID=UPI0039069313
MHRNKELYNFMLDNTWKLTEQWYESLDKTDPKGVYSSKDPKIIEGVKKQNYEFHLNFCKIFILEESVFINQLETWILKIAQDKEHLSTPVHYILREFFRTEEQYLDLIDEFMEKNESIYTRKDFHAWYRILINAFSKILVWFTQENYYHSQKRLQGQQELIMELSSPVISLNREVALLPLVGDIDTVRAKFILENTLEHCSRLGVNNLLLDLSGVVMVDTMVAHQLFQLIEALSLIGVKTTLSGLRPEIAQTAVQLGLSFDKISIKSTLSNAINSSAIRLQ